MVGLPKHAYIIADAGINTRSILLPNLVEYGTTFKLTKSEAFHTLFGLATCPTTSSPELNFQLASSSIHFRRNHLVGKLICEIAEKKEDFPPQISDFRYTSKLLCGLTTHGAFRVNCLTADSTGEGTPSKWRRGLRRR